MRETLEGMSSGPDGGQESSAGNGTEEEEAKAAAEAALAMGSMYRGKPNGQVNGQVNDSGDGDDREMGNH